MATMSRANSDGSGAAARPSALVLLPRDVLDTIVGCLVGWDLLQLASVSRFFHEELLADAALWEANLTQPQHDWQRFQKNCKDAKRMYASYRSFWFRGKASLSLQRGERGACIEALRFLPTSSQRNGQLFVPLAPQRFAIDVWFSLNTIGKASGSGDALLGGIILGAQSARWQDAMVWADYHQQFIHIDAQCNLYSSVVGESSAVASNLQFRRWYHLALVFDVDEERIFLDGKLVRQMLGRIHRDWRSLYFMQIGTGCISGGSVGSPSPKFAGWYPFNGAVDEFRIWEDPLTAEDVASLAADVEINARPSGSLQACDKSAYLGPVERVRSSRPRERTCVVLA